MAVDKIIKGWFTEVNSQWPGIALSLEVEEVLFHERSKYQDVLVFDSKTWGRIFCLDGAIQTCDRDEFMYQEMMTHPVMCAHPNPEKVLVVGGGDGGVLREVCRHSTVKHVDHCEIDEMVIAIAKKYLPDMARGYQDPRVSVHVGDAFEFIKSKANEYDVVICDSSDPNGPAESLFGETFYKMLLTALKPQGMFVGQGENMFLHLPLIGEVLQCARGLFAHAEYGVVQTPTYPAGSIGLLSCSKDPSLKVSNPVRELPQEVLDQLQCYSPEMHRAAYVLPPFVKRQLSK